MEPEPYLRLPRRRARRRPFRRPPRWLLPLGLMLVLVLAGLAAGFQLRSRLVRLHAVPAGSGWEYLGFRDRAILLVKAHRRDPVLFCVVEDGLARSSDGGWSWDEVPWPPGFARPSALAVGTQDPELLLLGTESGLVYRSEDGGRTWAEVLAGGGGRVELAAFDVQRSREALLVTAGRDGGLWRSADYGRTWSRVAAGPLVTAGFHPREGQVLYAAAPARVSRSNDGGKSWAHRDLAGVRFLVAGSADAPALRLGIADRLLSLATWDGPADTSALPGEPTALIAHPTDCNLLYLGTAVGVWRSADGGASWILYSEGLGRRAITGLCLGPEGRTLYVGTAGAGLWRYSPAGPGEGMLP
ncbi:MAG: hypothetical protein RDU89_06590 [bacterium]|nr:hypothetical protein [bacterium]